MATAKDSKHTPLDAALGGDLIIEASAGTGKTYALTTLAARAVVEAEVGIHRLLVVTFTVSATGELRHRIRRALRDALAGFTQGGGAPSTQAQALLERWRGLDIDSADAAARLTRAVRDLDRANILTIHGLCQRLLTEFAFDGAIPFGFEVSGDDTAAVATAVRDFWRRCLADAPVAFLEYAQSQRFTPTALADWVQELHPKPDLLIRGGAETDCDLAASFEEKHAVWLAEFAAVREVWLVHGAAFLEALTTLRWYRNSESKLARVCGNVQQAFAADDAQLLPFAEAGHLGGNSLAGILLKRPPQTLPESPLLACFDRLGASAERICASWLRTLRSDLLDDVRASLRRTAWQERQLGFNALLTETARALDSAAGPLLAQRIRERFPLALVDEFQDTDGLQARILAHIYPATDAAAPPAEQAYTGLAIVGDPKQSIYRFRGADVFAYLQTSRRSGDRQLRLDTNYRSTPALVGAVNAIFERPQPFLLPELNFDAVRAATPVGEGLRVCDDDYDAAPLQLRLQPKAEDKLPSKEAVAEVAARGAAAEIAYLLRLSDAGRATLDGVPLSGGDIAVLVRTSAQGQATAAALRALGVQSVEMGDVGVFETAQAEHLHRLLAALAEPTAYNRAARLRGVLSMDAFGLGVHELAALNGDDRTWAAWEDRFRRWRATWRTAGVAALIRLLLFTPPTNCATRLLTLPDGPRQLTNVLHLADLLQRAESRERLSPGALVDWLAWRRNYPQRGDDDAQLRLESDERLVKVVTVHRAKGLEFPVVFCPFAWYRRRLRRGPTAQHHEPAGTGFREVLDLAPNRDAHSQEYIEDQAEELRLLYVALTRAKHRCVVTWAQANDYEQAPLAWLLHDRQGAVDDTALAMQRNRRYVCKLDAGSWQREVEQFAAAHPNEFGLAALALAPGSALAETPRVAPPPARARRLHRPLRLVRQMTSYSALAGSTGAAASLAEHVEVERPDHDQREDQALAAAEDAAETQPGAATTPQTRLDAFSFPRGRRVGDCLHALFEASIEPQLDFDGLCRATLAKHGLEGRWAAVARTIVERARHTPLAPPQAGYAGFRLVDLRNPIAEMEFQLPVVGLDRLRLGECLATHGYPNLPLEAAGAITGFLRGFIDLVAEHRGRYYVVDYKSNWLGDSAAAYSPAALRRAMRDNGYHLQYLLYLAALNRHLRLRLPGYDYDRHLGGAFYLFVRGMAPERPGYSVYFDKPTRSCIEAVDACFGERS